MADVTVVQTAIAANGGSGSDVFTFGASPTPGNLLLFVLAWRDSHGPSTPAGVTLLDTHTYASDISQSVFYRVVESGDSATWTFAGLTDYSCAVAYEVTPVDGTTPFDAALVWHNGDHKPATDGQWSVTPTSDAVGGLAITSLTPKFNTSVSVSSPWSAVVDSDNNNDTYYPMYTAQAAISDTSTLTTTWTDSATAAWVGTTILLRPAAGSAPVEGSGTATADATASGTGVSERLSTGSAPASASASGAGVSARVAAAAAVLLLTATGAGASERVGSGTAGMGASAFGVGISQRAASGTAGVTLTASGTGTSARTGSGTATADASASGVGSSSTNPIGTGTALAVVTASGAGVSGRVATGTATIAATATGTATSERTGAGTAAAVVTATGQAGHSDTTVTPAERVYSIPADPRTIAIPADPRVLTIEAESRVLKVRLP